MSGCFWGWGAGPDRAATFVRSPHLIAAVDLGDAVSYLNAPSAWMSGRSILPVLCGIEAGVTEPLIESRRGA